MRICNRKTIAVSMLLAVLTNAAYAAPPVSQVQATLLRLMNQVQQLQDEIRLLRGDVEVQTNDIAGIRKRQRDVYLDLDQRIHTLEKNPMAGNESTAEPVKPAGATLISSPAGAITSDPAVEKSAYQAAFGLLKDGDYGQAAKAFDRFLVKFPDGHYASNALYWRAETSYVTRDFNAALGEFQRVLDQYPDSAKVSDAKLKIGFIHFEHQDWTAARATLEGVRTEYPESTAASLAYQRIQKIPR